MPESRPTTIRFSEPVYRRLEQACEHAGLTVNALVIVACLEWLDRHHQPGMPVPEGALAELTPMRPSPPQFLRHLGLRSRRRGEQPFDRFTGRAKNALALAQADAGESEHPITPLHLLLGLALEGQGIAAQVLTEAGVSTVAIQRAIADTAVAGPPGEPSAETKRTVELAFQAATDLGHRYVGTEHLLLALVRLGGVPLADQELADSVLRRLRAE